MLLQAAVNAASFRPLQWHGQPYAEALYITFYQRSPGNSPMLSPAIFYASLQIIFILVA